MAAAMPTLPMPISITSRRWQAAHVMVVIPSASPELMQRAIRRSGLTILSQPENGFVAFTVGRNQAAFTPVKVYHGLSRRERGKVSELKVSRAANVARMMATPSTGLHETDDRSAQLEK